MSSGVQTMFDFEEEQPKALSEQEQQEVLQRFAKKHGLLGLNLEHFKFKPRQFTILQELLERPELSTLIEEGMGGGKTAIFVVEAIKTLNEGGRVVFVTVQQTLVEQCAVLFRKLCSLPGLSVVELSGKIPPAKRKKLHSGRPQVTISTKIVLLNDFDLVHWDGVRSIYLDEVQGCQGKDAGVELTRRLIEKNKELGNCIRLRAMSGTVAASEPRLLVLQDNLKPERSIAIATREELAVASEEEGEHWENGTQVIEEMFEVELDPQLKSLCHQLRIEAVRCEGIVEDYFSEPMLFRLPEDRSYRIPTYAERAALWNRIENIPESEDSRYHLMSVWSELNTYCLLFDRLSSMGRFAFADYWYYLFVKRYIQGELYLPEIEGRLALEERGKLSRAKKAVVDNVRLLPLVESIFAETPYSCLKKGRSWDEINQSSYLILSPWERGIFWTKNSLRRREVMIARNKQLRGENANKTVQARIFFDDALAFMAHREFEDSSKIDLLSERLNLRQEIIRSGRSFVFTNIQRHAEFLAELLEFRSADSGFHPVAVHGGRGAGMDKYRETGLQGFRDLEFDLLVTTVSWAGTGMDVPDVKMGIYCSFPDSDPVKFLQSRGRIVGRTKGTAYIDVLTTKKTLEPVRYFAAKSKGQARRKAVLKRFGLLEPQYEALRD